MVKPEQLEKLGTQISKEYLEKQIPLTEGLEKVSTLHGLNQNQVHRVAETANVKTYLELMKTAQDDSYIEFDIANPNDVIEQENNNKTASNSSDYLDAPRKDWAYQLLQEKKASKKHAEAKEQEKTAEEQKPQPAWKRYNETAETLSHLKLAQSRVLEDGIRIESRIQPIYSIVKQAYLSGTEASALEYTIKEASEFGDYILDELTHDLNKDGIKIKGHDLEKYAGQKINENNKLVEKVHDFHNDCINALQHKEEYEKIAESLPEEGTLVKLGRARTSLEFAGSMIKNLFQFAAKHPVLTALGTGTGYGAYKGINYAKNKQQGTFKNQVDLRNKLKRSYGYQ